MVCQELNDKMHVNGTDMVQNATQKDMLGDFCHTTLPTERFQDVKHNKLDDRQTTIRLVNFLHQVKRLTDSYAKST